MQEENEADVNEDENYESARTKSKKARVKYSITRNCCSTKEELRARINSEENYRCDGELIKSGRGIKCEYVQGK